MVFIAKRNKPIVTKVIGSVKNIIIGRIKIFSNPNTMATPKAVLRLVTDIPVIKLDNTNTAMAVSINFINISFIVIVFDLTKAITMPIVGLC